LESRAPRLFNLNKIVSFATFHCPTELVSCLPSLLFAIFEPQIFSELLNQHRDVSFLADILLRAPETHLSLAFGV